MKCNQCQNDAPIQRIAMGNHRFCSGACVVKYAGTNKNVPWLKSEAYQMYYETDFDSRIKDVLSEDEINGQEDTGHQGIQASVPSAGEDLGSPGSTLPMVGIKNNMELESDRTQESSRKEVCLCRSGALDVYKNKFKASGMAKGQEPRQNCADKRCACFNV